MLNLFKKLMNAVNFVHLPKEEKKIVVYSEGKNYWTIFDEIIYSLTKENNFKVCYLTSDENDPGIKFSSKNFSSFLIDEGYIRNWLFSKIDADIVLMTMPDLGKYNFKRANNNVHYIYLQHALMSLHMAYQLGAFDNYDAIFCAGPHHLDEIREMEKVYNLKKKIVAKIGYARVDKLLKFKKKQNTSISNVLIAPTWGKDSLLEGSANVSGLIEKLLSYGFKVTLRPHPETVKRKLKIIKKINNKYLKYNSFTCENNIENIKSYFNSDIMITDWSGSALEYGLCLEKPVIFLDLPKKINNPEFEKIAIKPFEEMIRKKIGTVTSIENLNLDLINSVFSKKIRIQDYVYNIGDSSKYAVNYIKDFLSKDEK